MQTAGASAIFVGSVALFEWAEDDRATRRLVVAQVVNAKLATRVEVARVFGLHVNTVSRIAQEVAAEGVAASLRHKRGPRGPFKVTPAVVTELRGAVDERADGACRPAPVGATLEDQAVAAAGPPRDVSAQAGTCRTARLGVADDELPMKTQKRQKRQRRAGVWCGWWHSRQLNQLEQPLAAVVALTLTPGQRYSSRYLGLTLFYPALQVVGLLELAAQVYQLAGMLRFGVQQVFTELFCLALLQEPSVERIKHVLRSDLGAVMGSPRAACVKTLRRKLDDVKPAASGGAAGHTAGSALAGGRLTPGELLVRRRPREGLQRHSTGARGLELTSADATARHRAVLRQRCAVAGLCWW